MKKTLILVSFLAASLLFSPSDLLAGESAVRSSVQSYFSYLKSGDVENILNSLADPIYSERKELLMENSAYPEFLRETYRNAGIEIKNTKKLKGGRQAVDVVIDFGNQGPPLETKFVLKRVDGAWKISEEMEQ